MAAHVAIVDRRYVEPILSGRKTVECRLTRTARAPFGRVTPGERVYLKQSSGPFFAAATIAAVYLAADLDPAGVDQLRERYDRDILGDADFWKNRRTTARYATLIWLRDVRPIDHGPTYRRRHMVAWYVLDDEAAPLAAKETADPLAAFEVPLTAGAIRNGYVALPLNAQLDPACVGAQKQQGQNLQLDLLDGPTVHTDVVANGSAGRSRAQSKDDIGHGGGNGRGAAGGGRFRWRGWGAWFGRCGVVAGDRLRFIVQGRRHFRVEPVRVR